MFFWRASTFLDAMRRFLPKTAAIIASMPSVHSRDFQRMFRQRYPLCENISVDYGVMEKAAAAGMVWAVATDDIGWSDVGSWNAAYQLQKLNADGHALRSDAIWHDSRGCYVDAPHKMVALVGVSDLVVVDTPDALLIASRARAQDVGNVVQQIEQRKFTRLL
jgi:mannose-1-phosphate guanylyltransferase